MYTITIPESFDGLDKMIVSIAFFEPGQQTTTKTFTHQNYPGLQVEYPSDWSLNQEDRGEKGMTLTFSKDGLKLEYGIGTAAVFGFGPDVPACTNNTNLYLSPDNSEFYRIRTNEGERFYVKNYEVNTTIQDQQHFESLRQGTYEESKSKWVYGVPGQFEICLTVQGQTHVIDTTYPVPEGIATSQENLAGMTTIKLKNVDLSKQSLLAEADQIVASTKF
jgi:hypothetical protein